MAENSKISWTDHTFNPWIGCTKVSPGCANCYAETLMDKRYGKVKWGKGNPRQRTSAANWKLPLKWNREAACIARCSSPDCIGEASTPFVGSKCGCGNGVYRQCRPRVFCASLADWLDDEVPIEWLADLLMVVFTTPNLDWLMLSKRIENCISRLKSVAKLESATKPIWASHMPQGQRAFPSLTDTIEEWISGKPPENVWIGVSTENQELADKRIPKLLEIPARIRFLSVEPMLGLISFGPMGDAGNLLCGVEWVSVGNYRNHQARIDWVIFGGESGKGSRRCNADWIRHGVKQCEAAGVASFVKQLGSVCITDNINAMEWPDSVRFTASDLAPYAAGGRAMLADSKGGNIDEFPDELRARQFPTVK